MFLRSIVPIVILFTSVPSLAAKVKKFKATVTCAPELKVKVLNVIVRKFDSDTETERDLVEKATKKLGLKPKDVYYRAINNDRLSYLLNTGTDYENSDITFVYDIDEVNGVEGDDKLMSYPDDPYHVTVAIFDKGQFEIPDGYRTLYKYPDRKLDALLGVVVFKFEY